MKNKKGEFGLGTLTVGGFVLLFVGIIVAIALMPQIFLAQAELTTKQTVTNDSLTYNPTVALQDQINESFQMNVTNAQTGWRETGCAIEVSSVTNSTGTAYTETTDYVFSGANGNLTLVNTAKVNASIQSDNLTYVTYSHCLSGYNNDSGSRGVAGIIGLFVVLALMAFVVTKLQE